MKIALNWLKEYIDLKNFSIEDISKILTDIGLEVEGIEEKEEVPGGLRGLVIGQVVECKQHPNADRLSLCKVNVGGEDLLQIVCGAPNVANGQKVVVATVGSMLYPTTGDPFKIKKGKIRGEVSEGMICAEDEIGLGESHDGIMVLEDTAQIGNEAADYFGIQNQIIYDIGLTPNRSDATSHIGVARDLLAYFHSRSQGPHSLNLPEVHELDFIAAEPVKVKVEDLSACPRFSGVYIQNINVGPSPDWLKSRLLSIGQRPVNNIVDITNFVLHEYGQPMHAYDSDKIANAELRVKTLKGGTSFTTLDGIERTLHDSDLMICDGNDTGLCIAGVLGGSMSGVTEETANVFLESAYFEASQIRKTSSRHQIRSDAAVRYEKGADPSITVLALKRAARLILEIAGGEIASDLIDIYPEEVSPNIVTLRFSRLNMLIGQSLEKSEVKSILEALGMMILNEEEDSLELEVPLDKTDVTREVDLIEEVLRIYGLNRIEDDGVIKQPLAKSGSAKGYILKEKLSNILVGMGFSEIMSLSLIPDQSAIESGLSAPENLVYVNNTSNTNLNVMRPSLLTGGLEAVLRNQNRKNPDLKLFEWGRAYKKVGDEYLETELLGLWTTGFRETRNWLNVNGTEQDFYALKSYVEAIFRRIGLKGFQEEGIDGRGFSFGVHCFRGKQTLGTYGIVSPELTEELGIKKPVHYAELHWHELSKVWGRQKLSFKELNKYPSVSRDLSIVVDRSVKFSEIEVISNKVIKGYLTGISLFDVYENEEQLGKNKKSYSINLVFENPDATLKDKEIDKIMSKLVATFESKLEAHIRR